MVLYKELKAIVIEGSPVGKVSYVEHKGQIFVNSLDGEIFKATVAGSSPEFKKLVHIGDLLSLVTGYDEEATQTLKNVTGTFTWVDDA